jgi:monoamine oxidase
MTVNSCDVLVIGAGAAGISAAAELARGKRSAIVLEARDRIGGRIWTRHEPGLSVPVELGAEFIHGRPQATFELMQRFGLAAVDAQGRHWTLQRGRLRLREDEFLRVREALERSRPRLRSRDQSFSRFLAGIGAAALSKDERALATTLVEGFDAADPERVSARSIVEEWVEGGALDAPQFRPMGGYGALMAPLADSLKQGRTRLQLESTVHTIRWERGRVVAEGSQLGHAFKARARCAIVTLPIGVLQRTPGEPGAVRFDPPLGRKEDAIRQLGAGPVLKAVLRFREPFWERANRGECGDAGFFHAPEAPFPTFWTTLPVRAPVLVAWTGGPKASRLVHAGLDDVVEAALASARSLFGPRSVRSARLESAQVHDWQRDPFARGAYSYVMKDGGKARRALARPLQNTLFFAGEAADIDGEAGTVAGALQTGRAAARAANRRMRD